jgi:SNF2 family DNA or RNA helicase
MIPKSAIKKYLARPRLDYSTWKKLPGEEIRKRMRALPVRPPIWNKLKKHQRVMLLIGAQQPRFLFLADTGAGKTLLSIALARYFRRAGTVKSVLVLVPRRVNKYAWMKEIKKHCPNVKACVLTGSSAHKWQQLEQEGLLFIESLAGFVRMSCKKGKTRRGRVRLLPDRKLIKRAAKRFQGLIVDESTGIKNPRRLPYRVCKAVSKGMEVVFELTGTPFGRDPKDIWSQMYLVDKGHTLGETLGLFRAAFFTESIDGMGFAHYTFDERKHRRLHTFLQNRSIRYPADQADLPKVTRVPELITLPHDAREYYQRARQSMIDAKGSYQDIKGTFMRMRQISSGFIGYTDDESGEKAKFVFPDNPKLDLLLSKIEETHETSKMVVFAEFIYSIDRIAAELKRLGIEAIPVYGKTKHPDRVLDDFDNDDKQRVLILQNSMVMGLNLQIARYGVFYESPVSALMRKQAERRIERQHSKFKRVVLIDLMCRNTVDEQIRAFHASGEDLIRAIVEGKSTP